jgi:hypothetical protein
MICLECATNINSSGSARPAIGPAFQPRNGKRRFICTACEVPPFAGGG